MQYRVAYGDESGKREHLSQNDRHDCFLLPFVQQSVLSTVFNAPGKIVIAQLVVRIWQIGCEKTIC